MATVAAAAAAAAATDSARSPGRKLSVATSDAGGGGGLGRIGSELSVIGGLTLINVIDFSDEECLIVRVSHDKTLWAVGLANGRIQLYTTETCTLVYSLEPPQLASKESVTCLSFVPADASSQRTERKHLLLATYATGQVRMWHYTGVANQLLWTLTEQRLAQDGTQSSDANHILCLACSPDGLRFVTGGSDGTVRVYEVKRRCVTNLCQSSFSVNRVDGHRNRVCSVAYHPLGRQQPAEYGHIFVSGGWDNTVQVWDDRRPRSLWVYFGPHVCGTDAIDIDPVHNHILTASWERHKAMLQVWKFHEDIASGRLDSSEKSAQDEMLRAKPLGELPQDPLTTPSMGYVAQWLSEQYMVFAGSNANLLKIVDRGTLNIIGSVTDFPKGVYSVASLLPDGTEPHGRRSAKVGACSGSRLYVFRFERK